MQTEHLGKPIEQRRPQSRVALLVTSTLLLCGGCSSKWQAFEEIELGQPLPPDCRMVKQGREVEDGRIWDDVFVWQFPFIVADEAVVVALDADDRAVGKAYRGMALGNWAVAQSAKMRWVAEVLHRPKTDPNESETWASGYVDNCESVVHVGYDGNGAQLPGPTPAQICLTFVGFAVGAGWIHEDCVFEAVAEMSRPRVGETIWLINGFGGSATVRRVSEDVLRIERDHLLVCDELLLTRIAHLLGAVLFNNPGALEVRPMRRPPSEQRWMPPGGPRRVRFPRAFREVKQR